MGFIQTLSRTARLVRNRPGLDEVMRQMDALEAADRRIDALGLGSSHAPRLDDPRLWSRLGTLRMAAVGEAIARATPRPAWPPELADPFPGLVGIPEIDAADLDWRIVGGAVLHHGSLLVRGMLDRETTARLRTGIDRALEGYDAWWVAEQPDPSTGDYLPIPVAPGEPLAAMRPWSRDSGGVWAIEAPRLFQVMLDIYEERGLTEAVAGYLGERPVLSIGKTVFRRAEPDTSGAFHQDGAFMGAGIRTLNIWTALSDCGSDAPGLEVVARRVPYIVETGTHGAYFDWAVARDKAEGAAGDAPIVFPQFRAGDSLIFDQFMLHSTGVMPGMTKRRYALESWFFAPSAYSSDQIPIVI